MSIYRATVKWQKRAEEDFIDNQYSRGHQWQFDGGSIVHASSSPEIVPLPYSVAENVDPEEAFIASLSSCHMLFFLSIAAKKKFTVVNYEDHAEGLMDKNEDGKLAMTQVTLMPKVTFTGESSPTDAQLAKMHHLAHQQCFIANSVKTEVITKIVN